jgi:hypothetical protein
MIIAFTPDERLVYTINAISMRMKPIIAELMPNVQVDE